MRRGVARLLALAVPLTMALDTVQAADTCWKEEAVTAARLREMEIMVMAVGLRCKSLGFVIDQELEKFRSAQKTSIRHADNQIREHFGATQSKQGKIAYDQYLTGLANFYGLGRTDQSTCRMFDLVIKAAADPRVDASELHKMAGDLVREPKLPGPKCGSLSNQTN